MVNDLGELDLLSCNTVGLHWTERIILAVDALMIEVRKVLKLI